MIVKVLEIFTEYLSVILCIHKVARKKVEINWYSLLDFICCLLLIYVGENVSFGKLILYVYLFAYIKIRVTGTWKQTVKSFAITMCLVPILELLLYAIISDKFPKTFDPYLRGLIINSLIILGFLLWKEKYLTILINIITKFKKVIFLILLIILFKYLISYYTEYKMINSYFIDQLVICFLIVVLMLILWIDSENEKRNKAEELRTYQLYTSTFEEALATIRMKQHEFDNHINAIKCMQYTIHDTEKLIYEQNKYCDKILQDNKYNKLLKMKTSPVLIGYLYSKFTAASAHGINIEYEIQDISIERISINDLIEIIGILFDNAVEALEHQNDKEIEIKLLQTDNKLVISIINRSERKTNTEIEKFFEFGYSTKGNGHGIGLHRANMLLKKYKAYIQVENIDKHEKNYLSFKVMFDIKIKGIA